MCSHVVPLMRAQTSGRIINISSNLVDSPIVPYHSYITAKGGLVGMTALWPRSWAASALPLMPLPQV